MIRRNSLTNDPVWKVAADIAEYAYGLGENFPEDERWGMTSSLKHHAFALTDDIAEAAGSHDPRDRMHSLGHAKKELFGLKNVITMGKRAKYYSPDPDKMLAIDDLIKNIEQQFIEAQSNIPEYLKQFDTFDELETTK